MRSLLLMLSTTLSCLALDYPETRKTDVTETLHGIEVVDPYRWLEDDQAEETKAWVKQQNELTQSYLKSLPNRDEIRNRLTKVWEYERISIPEEKGGQWFYRYNSGLQNQSVIKVSDRLEDEGRVLLDPNTLSDDGTVSIGSTEVSNDGKLMIYLLSSGGSDWKEIRVMRVSDGKPLEDHLQWVKFSGVSWAKDDSGFFYNRYPQPAKGEELTGKTESPTLCFHRLGDPQSKDTELLHLPEHPRRLFGSGVSEDGRFLVISMSDPDSTNNRVWIKDLEKEGSEIQKLLDENDARYQFLGNEGARLFFLTDLDAPRYRVIEIDLKNPAPANWKELIAQRSEQLDGVSMAGGNFFCQWLRDARDVVTQHALDGKQVREIDLPGLCSVSGFRGDKDDDQTFYSVTSFTDPGAIYRLDIGTGESTLWRKPDTEFDGSAYETKQVFIESKDGTKVPAFITHKKGIKLDGSHRTILYGYGGFNINLGPSFSMARAVWLERGGVFVLANLRGGGEYGREWHLAGTRLRKQNVFDDAISVAEWLIKENYTTSSKLAIQGGSNGGLLVGACMTQRPDLFGAALPAVGVLDMLRFNQFTIGWAWETDYGRPEDAQEFKALYAYSPYHRLKPGTRYPATLVTTGDHDDRVVPAHSFKFAARLQEYQAKDAPPTLIRIAISAGHGAGTALTKVLDRVADEWAFLEANLK